MSQSVFDVQSSLTKSTAAWAMWLSRGSLVLFWGALLVATHCPPNADAHQENPFDKILHFVAYGGLAFLLAWVVSLRSALTLQRAALVIGICCLAGALDEITQPWTGRNTDLHDWYADVVGAIAGVAVFMLLTTMVRRCADASETAGV